MALTYAQRTARSEFLKARWRDPAFRAAQIASRKSTGPLSAAHKKAISKGQKKLPKSPEVLQALADRMKARWADPTERARLVSSMVEAQNAKMTTKTRVADNTLATAHVIVARARYDALVKAERTLLAMIAEAIS